MSSRFNLTGLPCIDELLAAKLGRPERLTLAEEDAADAAIAEACEVMRKMKDAAPRYEHKAELLSVREPRHFVRRGARRRGELEIE